VVRFPFFSKYQTLCVAFVFQTYGLLSVEVCFFPEIDDIEIMAPSSEVESSSPQTFGRKSFLLCCSIKSHRHYLL